jgi:hypothetical protein
LAIVLSSMRGASAQTFEDWYRMWNFRDEDIAKLMDGVYKSGVAKVQPVEAHDHHTKAGAERVLLRSALDEARRIASNIAKLPTLLFYY